MVILIAHRGKTIGPVNGMNLKETRLLSLTISSTPALEHLLRASHAPMDEVVFNEVNTMRAHEPMSCSYRGLK